MTARSLPPLLREGIARFTRDIKPADLAAHAARLSEQYRARQTSQRIEALEDVAAYLTARLPATYAAMGAGLDWTVERLEAFAPLSVLDIGAGPGTASWAAAEIFPSLDSFTLLDSNRALLDAARGLASGAARLADAKFLQIDVAQWEQSASADLVLAGYALAELSDATLARVVPRLWAATKSVLVIVEPGTPDGYARILNIRRMLLETGARIAAPCPGAYPCPIKTPDWCHFSVRLPRLAAHMRAKAASVPFEDERFSYLAVARETVALRERSPRILAEPHRFKPGLRLKLCADGAISQREILKRDKERFRTVARKTWGDSV